MCYMSVGRFSIDCGVGWGVVSGWFYPVSYGVAAFICYPYVCVSEQVRDLAYLWGNVCESRPFLVFSVLW